MYRRGVNYFLTQIWTHKDQWTIKWEISKVVFYSPIITRQHKQQNNCSFSTKGDRVKQGRLSIKSVMPHIIFSSVTSCDCHSLHVEPTSFCSCPKFSCVMLDLKSLQTILWLGMLVGASKRLKTLGVKLSLWATQAITYMLTLNQCPNSCLLWGRLLTLSILQD